MLSKHSTLDKIEVAVGSPILFARFKLYTVLDGEVLHSQLHRVAVEGDTLEPQMVEVNNHLNQMGWPSVPREDIDKMAKYLALVLE